MGYVCLPVLVESQLLLAHHWVGLILRLSGYEDYQQPELTSCCEGADPTVQNSPQCLQRSPFDCTTCGANLVVFFCGLKLATECAGSGASWKGLLCRPRSASACDWSRIPIRSYKMICIVCVGPGDASRGHTMNRGWPSLVLSSWQLSKSPREPISLPLLGSCL